MRSSRGYGFDHVFTGARNRLLTLVSMVSRAAFPHGVLRGEPTSSRLDGSDELGCSANTKSLGMLIGGTNEESGTAKERVTVSLDH